MSKELEALEKIGNAKTKDTSFGDTIKTNLTKQYKIIETALKEYEGAKNHIEALNKERIENSIKLKALEIIKEKRVDVDYLIESVSLEEYNKHIQYCYGSLLTQEEYDLLKEVLL